MLKQLLPKELWKTKITSKEFCCFYDNEDDYINFNRKYILFNYEWRKILSEYFNDIVTKRDCLIFCLLHELGHRYNRNKYDLSDIYMIKKAICKSDLSLKEINFKYWEVPDEKDAMDFAKHYFKLYKEKQNNEI